MLFCAWILSKNPILFGDYASWKITFLLPFSQKFCPILDQELEGKLCAVKKIKTYSLFAAPQKFQHPRELHSWISFFSIWMTELLFLCLFQMFQSKGLPTKVLQTKFFRVDTKTCKLNICSNPRNKLEKSIIVNWLNSSKSPAFFGIFITSQWGKFRAWQIASHLKYLMSKFLISWGAKSDLCGILFDRVVLPLGNFTELGF